MTKKEQAKEELKALPKVCLEIVTVPGSIWRDYALCCRINGVVYLQPKDLFKTNWLSEHIKKRRLQTAGDYTHKTRWRSICMDGVGGGPRPYV